MEYAWLTVLGIAFIFIMTTLGAACVYAVKKTNGENAQCFFFGFASGIMTAASVWSLLIPALEQATQSYGKASIAWILLSFVLGGAFLFLIEKLQKPQDSGLSIKSKKMFLAVTAHNVPEGLAVGFAFGRAQRAGGILSALWLAIGIGVQNFPEGAAVALPVKQELNSSKKAFLYGMASGAVEPVFAALGYFLAAHLTWIQPWALAFSAGAMIYVVAEELLPQAQTPLQRKVGAWGVMIGFLVMMTLDVAFG